MGCQSLLLTFVMELFVLLRCGATGFTAQQGKRPMYGS